VQEEGEVGAPYQIGQTGCERGKGQGAQAKVPNIIDIDSHNKFVVRCGWLDTAAKTNCRAPLQYLAHSWT
jgi:hypothetical protein